MRRSVIKLLTDDNADVGKFGWSFSPVRLIMGFPVVFEIVAPCNKIKVAVPDTDWKSTVPLKK